MPSAQLKFKIKKKPIEKGQKKSVVVHPENEGSDIAKVFLLQ